jgi:hypothetical protein
LAPIDSRIDSWADVSFILEHIMNNELAANLDRQPAPSAPGKAAR